MAGIADWNIGPGSFLTVRTSPLNNLSNLTFGYGTDLPNVSGAARGGIYDFDGVVPFGEPSQVVQITRSDSATTRGYNSGRIQVGWHVQDVEPPLEASADASKGAVASLFCCAQEVNDEIVSKPIAQPPDFEADKIEGCFTMDVSFDYFDGSVLLALRALKRFGGIVGNKLATNVDVAMGLGPGDFLGVILDWHNTEDLTISPLPYPTTILRGYTCTQTDFSDPTLRIMAAHDYTPVPASELTPYRIEQEKIWNIAADFSVGKFHIVDPALEGGWFSTRNTHGLALTHFEILKLGT